MRTTDEMTGPIAGEAGRKGEGLGRPLLDAGAAFAIFMGVSLLLSCGPLSASPIDAATAVNKDIGLLSLAFSLLAALNLALFRHLKNAYAHPRRNTKS